MSDMLFGFVKSALNDIINDKLPYIKNPMCVKARVSSVKKYDGYMEYTLKILDKNGNEDNSVAEVPGIKSEIELGAGDVAAVILFYGLMSDLYIVGKVN